MKKLFIIVLLCALARTLNAQNTYPFPQTGNVGIGTLSPASALDVYGAISISGITTQDTKSISIPVDGTYVIASGNRVRGTYTLSFDAANRVQMVVLLVSACQYDNNSSISILANNSYSGSTVMSNFRLLRTNDGSNVYLVFDVANRSDGSALTAHFEGTGAYGPNWGGTLSGGELPIGLVPFAANSGKFGIGTVNPQGTLHLKMDNNFSMIQRTNSASYAGHYYGTGPDNMIDYNFFAGLRENSDSYIIYNGFLGSNALTIDRNNSNIGMGTDDTHGYKFAVNGDVHAKKVVIDLTNWPDYVFKPTYNLRPLSEVKSYIDLNHHLPDMPPEKEVADNGLDLGESNKILTKKVEELTLYLIQMQKQIDQLKKPARKLKSKVK